MILIFQPDNETPVATCDLKPQKEGHLVVRVVDGEGRYRRIKFPVVTRAGESGIEASDMATATLLPGFQLLPPFLDTPLPQPDKKSETSRETRGIGKTQRSISQIGHEERRGRVTPSLAHMTTSTMDLNAQVLVRILRKLTDLPLYLDTALELGPDAPISHAFPMPALPAGRLLLRPAPWVVVDLPMVLGLVDLGEVAEPPSAITLPLRATKPLSLNKGHLMGVLEVRSPSELPEGMREMVFQSHFQSKVQEAMACGSP